MKNIDINQTFEDFKDLLGKQVSYIVLFGWNNLSE